MEITQSGEFWAVTAGLLWSVAVILFRLAGEDIPPLTMNLFKGVVALIVFLPFLLVPMVQSAPSAAWPQWPTETWMRLLISGVIGIAVADTLFFAALNRLGAGLNAVVSCLYFPALAVLAAVVLGDYISPVTVLGAALVITGIVVGSIGRSAASDDLEDYVDPGGLGGAAGAGLAASDALADAESEAATGSDTNSTARLDMDSDVASGSDAVARSDANATLRADAAAAESRSTADADTTATQPQARSRRDLVVGLTFGVIGVLTLTVSVIMVTEIVRSEPVLWTTSVRLLAGIVAIAPFVLFGRERSVAARLFKPSPLWRYALPAAILGGALAMLAWIAGFALTSVATAAILNQLSTIYIFVLASLVLKEPVTLRRAIAVGAAFAGAVLVIVAA